MEKLNKKSRRDFIKVASLAALGVTTQASSMVKLKAINSLLMPPPPYNGFGNYKAMVYIFLGGGCDAFNMLTPKSTTEYNEYSSVRGNLAIAQNSLLGINSNNFGLHPSLTDVHSIYNAGDLAFITNVGSMIEPVTLADFQNGTAQLPLGLFSHLDQTNHWQTANPAVRTNKGWGGKIADLIGSTNVNNNISMNISMSGSNIFQNGNLTTPYTMSSSGPKLPYGYGLTYGTHPVRSALIDSVMNYNYQDPYKKTYADTYNESIEASNLLKQEIDNLAPFATSFSTNNLSEQLEMVAKTIAVRSNLNFERQIFFINYGGWDHHDNLLIDQADKLTVVNNALNEFKNVLNELGAFNDVTTLVSSEFGRTLTSNGDGSDHAWGGHSIVMGGSVIGGQLYGTYPTLAANSSLFINPRGQIIPTTATDSLFSELALWYGVDPSDLTTIFPNLANFHNIATISTVNPPLGFMTM